VANLVGKRRSQRQHSRARRKACRPIETIRHRFTKYSNPRWVAKGYTLPSFGEAFSRYLPPQCQKDATTLYPVFIGLHSVFCNARLVPGAVKAPKRRYGATRLYLSAFTGVVYPESISCSVLKEASRAFIRGVCSVCSVFVRTESKENTLKHPDLEPDFSQTLTESPTV
jgi:hypothetical protein